MRPAGFAAIEAAKADGRWERAYAGPATMDVPSDFATALTTDPAASTVFEGLNKTGRFAVLWRVHTATPHARVRRIESLVKGLADGKVPGTSSRSETLQTDSKSKRRKVSEGLRVPKDDPPKQPRREGLRPRARPQ